MVKSSMSHFSNKYSSKVYTKSALDSVEQFFLKMILREHVREGESTMDDAVYLRPDKCILGFLNFDESLNVVFFIGSDASIAQDHLLTVLLAYCLLYCI